MRVLLELQALAVVDAADDGGRVERLARANCALACAVDVAVLAPDLARGPWRVWDTAVAGHTLRRRRAAARIGGCSQVHAIGDVPRRVVDVRGCAVQPRRASE